MDFLRKHENKKSESGVQPVHPMIASTQGSLLELTRVFCQQAAFRSMAGNTGSRAWTRREPMFVQSVGGRMRAPRAPGRREGCRRSQPVRVMRADESDVRCHRSHRTFRTMLAKIPSPALAVFWEPLSVETPDRGTDHAHIQQSLELSASVVGSCQVKPRFQHGLHEVARPIVGLPPPASRQ